MDFETTLQEAESVIFLLGLREWGNKLKAIRQSSDTLSLKAIAVLALYEGSNTLNDHAFSDNDAPPGMSGKEATDLYLNTIQALHEAAKNSPSTFR